MSLWYIDSFDCSRIVGHHLGPGVYENIFVKWRSLYKIYTTTAYFLRAVFWIREKEYKFPVLRLFSLKMEIKFELKDFDVS